MDNSGTYDTLYDVAVIGMAGRFPGAKNVQEFWQNLRDGVESISFFSDQELATLGLDPATLSDPNYVKAGGVLEGAELFDASFFGFTPRRAAVTDPQHRLLLECAWEALENAGYAAKTYAGRIGVYAGASLNTYAISLYTDAIPVPLTNFQVMLGNDKDYLATRISYKLNLKGPSITVQTACSTSLVAVHLAYQSLLNHECDIALAGGVSTTVPQNAGYIYQRGGIFSPDGHCRAFDAKAQGMVNGNGVGIVALKRLADALSDGDCIHAVIKGSAINNDGSLKVGYTAPSVDGQATVIAEALAAAGVEPETISYIEAHGTGTPLGDPIEIAALTQAFRARTSKKSFCAIGSVKTNVGHLGAAAGVTSLVKAVLALKHKMIPPSLYCERPNPQIDFANSPFYVNTALAEWRADGAPRRAGVSSFGFGGTNVHVVVEEAPPVVPSGESRPWQLLVLSARTESALEAATSNLIQHFKQCPALNLADVAYTLQVGREVFGHRQALVSRDPGDAIAALEALEPTRVFRAVRETNARPVVFVFPGEGSQYANMGRELYQVEPTFREQVDLGAECLKPHLGLDLRNLLYPAAERADEAAQQLQRASVGLPALFLTEYALAKLWMSWDIQPRAMIGHGLGEYTAACLAGVFSLEDALKMVARRGRSFEQLPQGAMLRVPLQAPHIPYLSSVTGAWITPAEATDPDYWAGHWRQTARFSQGVQELTKDPSWVLLEVGPGQTLTGLHLDEEAGQVVLSSLRHPGDQQSDVLFLLNSLGHLWLAGASVNWSGFYAHERRRRLPLPTYPFERQRYMIEPRKQAAGALVKETASGKKLNLADWGYLPVWKQSRPPARWEPGDGADAGSCWLVFVDACGLGSQMVKRLEQAGQTVIAVTMGREFAKLDNRVYAIDPRQRNDYDTLLQELRASDARPQTIVHLWAVTPDDPAPAGIERFEKCQVVGFYSLLFLAQALGDSKMADALQIGVVSSNVQAVTGEEKLSPEKATLLGMCKVIPQEYPNVTCRSIDIGVPEPDTWQTVQLVDRLIAELAAKSPDAIVAYRGNRRWVRTFDAVQLDGQAKGAPRLRENGVYLITGGLGGVGFILAEYLAGTVRARLVLTGRSQLPARDEWEQWLSTHDAQESISRKIQQVRALEEMGAEVMVIDADVASQEQMQQAIAQTGERFGQLHGVIHSAVKEGVAAAIQETGRAECEPGFRSQVHGLFALEKALQDIRLDFCLLQSSIVALVGGPGFAAYAAASAFVDAFAWQRNQATPVPWISVNWDSWQVGASQARTEPGPHLGAASRPFSMTPKEGVEVFRRVLSMDAVTQVVISTGDLQARMANGASQKRRRTRDTRRR
jgi:acyl transferase domain-containing protein